MLSEPSRTGRGAGECNYGLKTTGQLPIIAYVPHRYGLDHHTKGDRPKSTLDLGAGNRRHDTSRPKTAEQEFTLTFFNAPTGDTSNGEARSLLS